MNNIVEVAKIVGIIQDLAKDIEQDAQGIITYKVKKEHLAEVKDGAEAIIGFVSDLEKIL